MPEVTLDLSYDSVDAIPQGFSGLFDEKDGKFVLGGVNGMKTQTDVANVQEALRKERGDHDTVKNSLRAWGDLKPDEVRSQLDRIAELEAAAGGKLDDAAINKIVEGRLIQSTSPLQRQIETLSEENTTFKTENEQLKASMERRDMNESVRSVATEMKVHSTAIVDVEMVAASYLEKNEAGEFVVRSDAQGVTPGVDVKQFLKEMQKLRPHWWPVSEGGGANGHGLGAGEPNPWNASTWNVTQQGKIQRESGIEVATQLAKAAGTTIGGLPKKK